MHMCRCIKNEQFYSIMEIRKQKRRYYLQTMENEYSSFVAKPPPVLPEGIFHTPNFSEMFILACHP